MCAQYVVKRIQDGRMQAPTVQVRSSKGIEAFSADFQAEEDVSFIKNSKGCTIARVEMKTSE
jgi:hypothetical protein